MLFIFYCNNSTSFESVFCMKTVKSRLFKKYLKRRKSRARFCLSLGWLNQWEKKRHTRKVWPGTHMWDSRPGNLHLGPFTWDPELGTFTWDLGPETFDLGLFTWDPRPRTLYVGTGTQWNAGPILRSPYVNTFFS